MILGRISYRKTAEGLSEIENRSKRITARQRSILIMIDGIRTTEQLAQTINEAELRMALEEFLKLGLVKPLNPISPEMADSGPQSDHS